MASSSSSPSSDNNKSLDNSRNSTASSISSSSSSSSNNTNDSNTNNTGGGGGNGVEAFLKDRGIASLLASSGSDESVARGQNIAIALVAFGVLGALGASVRPIYRDYFAKRVGRSSSSSSSSLSNPTSRSLGKLTKEEQSILEEKAQHLDKLIVRLHELQIRHRNRHPLWYGEVPSSSSSSSSTEQDHASTLSSSSISPSSTKLQ